MREFAKQPRPGGLLPAGALYWVRYRAGMAADAVELFQVGKP